MKKILMFGFRDLGEIMKIAAAAERCGAELQPVGRESCTLTLEALRQAGIVCLKAVLTPNNRTWTPERLYRELERERRTMGGR